MRENAGFWFDSRNARRLIANPDSYRELSRGRDKEASQKTNFMHSKLFRIMSNK